MNIGDAQTDGGICWVEPFPYCCGALTICNYTVPDPNRFWPYLMTYMKKQRAGYIFVIVDRVDSHIHDTGVMKDFIRYLREHTTWEIMETPPRISHAVPAWTLVQGWFILPTMKLTTQDTGLLKAYENILSTRV